MAESGVFRAIGGLAHGLQWYLSPRNETPGQKEKTMNSLATIFTAPRNALSVFSGVFAGIALPLPASPAAALAPCTTGCECCPPVEADVRGTLYGAATRRGTDRVRAPRYVRRGADGWVACGRRDAGSSTFSEAVDAVAAGIRARLLSGDTAMVRRALTVLFARQTRVEATLAVTLDDNARGFDKPRAVLLTPFAERVLAGGTLSAGETLYAGRLLSHHSRQLARKAVAGESR